MCRSPLSHEQRKPWTFLHETWDFFPTAKSIYQVHCCICSGISAEWFFIHCFRAKLAFRNVGFCFDKNTLGADSEQGWEPTTNLTYAVNSWSGIWTQATLVGGKCFHHCVNPVPPNTLYMFLLALHCLLNAPIIILSLDKWPIHSVKNPKKLVTWPHKIKINGKLVKISRDPYLVLFTPKPPSWFPAINCLNLEYCFTQMFSNILKCAWPTVPY